ncbi:hypothetical protein DFQ28_004301 [Apophysomyces sp. BC1034]|nr:hypothetical protein DFQ29_003006 [Apophysomyces sp. BC1021]KAG0188835.1 hypothetical protein DFQ28_004301 [Apophysomyces sp. BC1034]
MSCPHWYTTFFATRLQFIDGINRKAIYSSGINKIISESCGTLSPERPIPLSESDTYDDDPPRQFLTDEERKFCADTLKAMMKHRAAAAFLAPVDPIAYNIPDYFDIIKHPMDLSTMKTKLDNNEYSTIDAFAADGRLMFDNCYLYNNAGDPVSLDAKKLEEAFNRRLKKAPSAIAETPAAEPPIFPPGDHPNTNTVERLAEEPTEEPINSITKPVQRRRSSLTALKALHDGAKSMPDDQFKRCEGAIKEMKKPKYRRLNWPFERPVDPIAWGATDYYDIVKKPMDMSTFEKKLYDYEYAQEDEFEADVRLMFHNCYLYNPSDHPVYDVARQFEQVFLTYWEKAHAKVSDTKVKKLQNLERQKKELEKKLKNEGPPEAPIENSRESNVNKKSTDSDEDYSVSSGRPTILRLKLNVKQEPPQTPQATAAKKPAGLGLSKEPPQESNRPKLALSGSPKSGRPAAKTTENKKQDELERQARSEKLRVERDMQTWREHEERRREFTKWAQAKKEKDRKKRDLELQKEPVDISKQKMTFQQFESTSLTRDNDFRELYTWHRDTYDYRHMPVPGFVRRSRISLTELRRKLLSARVRIENVKLQQEGNMEEGEADMDVE